MTAFRRRSQKRKEFEERNRKDEEWAAKNTHGQWNGFTPTETKRRESDLKFAAIDEAFRHIAW